VSRRGRIAQLSLSAGGVPKRAVASAIVGELGLAGDGHRDPAHHGGPERAVCLYSLEAIEALRLEGHRIEPGSLGENVTVQGLDWTLVAPGTRLRLGPDVVVEITRYTSPCHNIRPFFADGQYARVSEKRHPGWSRVYALVLRAGAVTTGDDVEIL
jgi:MOSC domain-containing protein YiiM